MPELSEEQVRWMRNRFVEMIQRLETLSEQHVMIREELNQVADALGRLLPPETEKQDKEE